MKHIQIYDPPMCCPTGICGVDIDLDLVRFASLLTQLSGHGIQVDRYNLASEPMAFAENPAIKKVLETEGDQALPVIFWDGEIHLQGRYPSKAEHPDWIRAAQENEEVPS